MSTNVQTQISCENDFELLKFINKGSFGDVHLVQHKIIGEQFAMKIMKKQNSPNQIYHAIKERDIMLKADSPFVVALYCTFETKRHLCMVMEYVEGGDVASLIKHKGPLPLELAKNYFAETALAIEHLHGKGIIHRDIKPENLLISYLGHIKLTDFGLSKIGKTLGDGDILQNCYEFNDREICGTPQYMAPEVILSLNYGKTIDWWSMGIILYEFLTSFHAFSGDNPEDVYSNVLRGCIDWPDESDVIKVPDDAKYLINCLMAPEPINRLGARGASEIKENIFFKNFNWNKLVTPQFEGAYNTCYLETSDVASVKSQFEAPSDTVIPIIHESDRENERVLAVSCFETSSYTVLPIIFESDHENKGDLSIIDESGHESEESISKIPESYCESEVVPVVSHLEVSEVSSDANISNMADTGIDVGNSIVSNSLNTSLNSSFSVTKVNKTDLGSAKNELSSSVKSSSSKSSSRSSVSSSVKSSNSKSSSGSSGKMSYCIGRVRAFFRSGFNRITRCCR